MSTISRSRKDQMISKALARTHDPKTSWEAAEKVNTNRLESFVLDIVKAHGDNGCTHDELMDHYWKMSANFASHHPEWTPDDMHSVGSITPRYAQLERKGLITRDGTTRKGKKGRSQLVMYYKK